MIVILYAILGTYVVLATITATFVYLFSQSIEMALKVGLAMPFMWLGSLLSGN